MAGNPAARTRVALLLGCGLFLGIIATFTGKEVITYTSSDAFCNQACHAHPHATAMWVQSGHFSNKRGVVTHCTDCHLPPGGIPYLTEKARLGFHDAYAEIFGDASKTDWVSKRRLDRALSFTYDASCIHCHSNLFGEGLSKVPGVLPVAVQQASAEQVRAMRIVARRMEAHLYYQRNRDKLRCINCHLLAGHVIPRLMVPREPVSESPRFPLAANGFGSYTEVVPGSNIKFHMIAVPGGTLQLGNPTLGACRQRDAGPAQTVKVSPFWMAQATVSDDELKKFVAQNKLGPASEPTQKLAEAYAEWLSHATGKKYRLPTEAEFEYACIAGGTMPEWVQSDSLANPDVPGYAALNAWGFMDLPKTEKEFISDGPLNGLAAWWTSDQVGVRFRLVRGAEAGQQAKSTDQPPVQPGVPTKELDQ